jgi:hypothetical protein
VDPLQALNSSPTPITNASSAAIVEEFARESEIFARQIDLQNLDTLELPLAIKKSPGLAERFFGWLNEYIKSLDLPGPSQDMRDWIGKIFAFFVQNWFLILIVTLILIVAWLVYVYFQLRSKPTAVKSNSIHQFEKPLQDLEAELTSALVNRFFQSAAKLRWKLFLARLKSPQSTTPLEYSLRGQTPGTYFSKDVPWIYALMFATQAEQEAEEKFSRFQTILQQNESGPQAP